MAISKELQELIAELMAPVGSVTIRRMFGGAGAFRDGLMFALISDDVLYFKVDDQTRQRFVDEGSGPFTYTAPGGKRMVMSYYEAPSRLMDDVEEFSVWAREAIDVSKRAQKPPPKRRSIAKRMGIARPGGRKKR